MKILKEHEISILAAFIEAVPNEVRDKIIEQLNEIGVAQREVNKRVVNFYKRGLLGAKPLRCETFSGFPEEVCAASFSPFEAIKLKAELWYVNGRPFSIEFSEPIESSLSVTWCCNLTEVFLLLLLKENSGEK